MTDTIDDLDERIVSRLALFEETETTEFTPLSEAVKEYIDFSQHPERRVYTGIREIDSATRGLAPSEMCVINGFAHNGKTVLVVEILIHNEGRPCVLFTPDETRTAVLVKLTAALFRIGAEELERRINQHDPAALDMLAEVAERFKNLAVFDDNISLHTMDRAMKSAEQAVGKVEFAIFDYADLLNENMETNDKLKHLKRWGKDHDLPFYVLHQSSRHAGRGGQKVSIDSGAYGGEQQAFIMIGVRRKINMLRDQIDQLEEKLEFVQKPETIQKIQDRIQEIRYDLIPRHQDTITINVPKNKRPPMTLVDEVDYKLDKETGRLINMHKDSPDDVPDMPLPVNETFAVGPSARDLLRKANH